MMKMFSVVAGALIQATSFAQERSAPPEIHFPPPVAYPGGRIGLQIGPAVPISDAGDFFNTGFDVRAHGGYEFMWGNFGLTPGLAFEYAHFGAQKKIGIKGASNYVGVSPFLKTALHMWMFAPYFGLGMGFDHAGLSGDLADTNEANNLDTSANGFGFGILFGMDVVFMPNMSAGLMFQVHPGFANMNDNNMGAFVTHFGATFLF